MPHIFMEKKPQGRKDCGMGYKLRHVQNAADGASPFPDRLVYYSRHMAEVRSQGWHLA